MLAFVLPIIILLVVGILDKIVRMNHLQKIIAYFLTLIPFVALQGSRDITVGADTSMYWTLFENTRLLSWSYLFKNFPMVKIHNVHFGQPIETGYIILNKFVSLFTDNPQVMLYVCAVLICTGFYIFICSNCYSIFWGTLVFFCDGLYMNSFNTMRQVLAIAIAINAFTAFKKKKNFVAILLIFLGYTIHNTARIMVLLLILYYSFTHVPKKLEKYFYLLAIFLPLIVEQITLIFPSYAGYTENKLYDFSLNGTLLLWGAYILFIVLLEHKSEMNTDLKYYLLMFSLFVVMQIMAQNITGMSRISMWFEPFTILFIDKVVQDYNICYPGILGKKNIIKLTSKYLIAALLIAMYVSYANTLSAYM